MRLTGFSKFLMVLAIVLGLFFAAKRFMPQWFEKNNTEVVDTTNGETPNTTDSNPTTTTTETTRPAPNVASAETPANDNSNNASSNFTYTAPKPVNGKLRGVVELGASGFNSFVVLADQDKAWELKKSAFGESLVYENMATEDDIRTGLKKYISQMLNFGVLPRDIHFVVSSAAANAPEVVKITKALKTLGYVVNTVTAAKEAEYGLKATLTRDFLQDAFMVDIGSGNTKIAWYEGNAVKTLETYGSKYFQKGISADVVHNEIKTLAAKVPADKQKMCFIIGGVPFDLAKTHRKDKERYTLLKSPADYSSLSGEKVKAGVNIYDAIAKGAQCDRFVFDWDSNFTIGFLLDLK